MPLSEINDIDRLKKINAALLKRVEQSMDQQGSAFALFQTAITLEGRVRARTEELHSALRRLEAANLDLVDAKEAAEQANLSKTKFLAAAGHDVLQPLNAANLMADALADLQTSDESRRLVAQVRRSLDTMETLIRTLLDISRLDAGVVQPNLADVDVNQMFDSVRSDFAPLADRKKLKLRFVETGLALRTDRTMLLRILQNIVSNAIRYTRIGGIVVGVRRMGAGFRIEVADTGCGVPPDQQSAIFEEFHRAAAGSDEQLTEPGLGLGLAIVRRMANTLGFRIGLTSVEGKGSVFSVHLPAVHVIAAKRPPELSAPARPRRYGLFGTNVLLVEDDDDTLEAMAALLTSWGCNLRVASTLSQAISELGDTGWTPDIVVSDQHLQGGDLGTETIVELRRFLGRDTPAVLATADESTVTETAAAGNGIELMRKPIKPAQLRALLAHILA